MLDIGIDPGSVYSTKAPIDPWRTPNIPVFPSHKEPLLASEGARGLLKSLHTVPSTPHPLQTTGTKHSPKGRLEDGKCWSTVRTKEC